MAKQVTIEHEDMKYTLEYTRKSIETMERRGFVVEDITKRPMTVIPELFAGAFLAHHKFVKRETVDAILNAIGDRTGLVNVLAEMYNEPILELIGDQEDTAGNVSWEKSW